MEMQKHRNSLKPKLYALLVIGLVIFVVWLGLLAKENVFIQDAVLHYGYGGIFFLSIVSGFNIVAPVPLVAFFPLFVASGLNQWITVLVVVVGTTIADVVSYVVGKVGRRLVSSRMEQTIARLEKLKNRVHYLPPLILFLFASFVPFPNEILIIPMAFLGYRLRHLLLPVLLGNAVFNTLAMIGTLNFF